MTDISLCRGCGAKLSRDDVYCPACGTRRPDSELPPPQTLGSTRVFTPSPDAQGNISICRTCGAPHRADAKFCAQCGGSLKVEEPSDGWPEVRRQLEQATTGEFEILRELGRGGMAAVYVARDLSLGRNVAIKVMAPGLLMGEGMVARFRQEAITIAGLLHPNIITIHGVRQAGNLHFFIMQLVEGGSLDGLIKRIGPLPVPLAQVILYQVGTGLVHAHNHGVVHRDIKPANVLLDIDGNAILTDFGIAKATAAATHLTQTGSTLGTPTYMSPEQCLARELSGASDQYSLGIVAYEMLTGRTPYSGSAFEVMQAHTTGTVAGFRGVRPDCPPDVEAAVLRMLARDPAQRFPSVAEAIEAVGGYLPGPRDPLRLELARLVKPGATPPPDGWKHLTPIPSHPTPLPAAAVPAAAPAPKPTRSKLLIRAAAGIVVVGALAGLATMMFGGGDEGQPAAGAGSAAAAAITFANPAESLMVRATAKIRALVQDSAGQPLTGQTVAWTSQNSGVATVTGTGDEAEVAALAAGTATIEAAVGSARGSVQIVVSAPPPGSLLVSAPASELMGGEELQLTVADADGQPLAGAVRWSSSNARVVAVDAARGLATGRNVGRARITATSGDRSGSVDLRVLGEVQGVAVGQPSTPVEAGRTVVLRGSVSARPAGYLGANGLAWRSSAPDVAAVSRSAGDSAVVSLLREGEATLTASADAQTGSVTLRVRPAPSAITVSLAPSSVDLELTEGAAASADRTVRISTTGGADPLLGAVQYEGGARDWLRTSLSADGNLTLRADGSGLGAGSYQARVPVLAGSVRQELAVRLTVAARPAATAIEPSPAAEREIGEMLAAYAGAINSRNEARVRELYPSITATGIRDMTRAVQGTDLFQVLPLAGTLRNGRDANTLEILVNAGIVPQSGVGQTRRMTYTVSRNARGWFIVGVRTGG